MWQSFVNLYYTTILFQVFSVDWFAVDRNVFIALSPVTSFFVCFRKVLACAFHTHTCRYRKKTEKKITNKQTKQSSHIYWPLMCNKKKFKSHFVFGNRHTAIELNCANKEQM